MRNLPNTIVPVEYAKHRNVQLHEKCLLCGSGPETAHHTWACRVHTHAWRPTMQRLQAWLITYIGPWASPILGQIWDLAVLEQWAATIAPPSLRMTLMRRTVTHDIGAQFMRHVVKECECVCLSHAKAREGLIEA